MKSTYQELKMRQADSGLCHMSKMEFFLQKPLTVFERSSMLDVYLTDFPKYVSDWLRNSIYETKTKTST